MSSSSSASAATQHLNDTHKAQVLAYLRFFAAKREQNAKEVDAVFEEQKDMRLLEEMYPVDEVGHILEEVASLVKGQLNEELEKWAHQSVLYLRQIFLQAEGNGVALQVDLSTLDDAVLLSGIEKLDLDQKKNPRGALNPSDLPDTRRVGSLKPVEGSVDVKLVSQIKELQDNNRSLLAKFEKLQAQCQAAQKEAGELKQRNATLEKDMSTMSSDMANLKASNKSAQQAEIDQLRAELAAAKAEAAKQADTFKAELKAQADTLASKVNNAPQYQQLKKLMNTKNEQLKEARARVKTLEEHLNKDGK